jgi:hypothetical protein
LALAKKPGLSRPRTPPQQLPPSSLQPPFRAAILRISIMRPPATLTSWSQEANTSWPGNDGSNNASNSYKEEKVVSKTFCQYVFSLGTIDLVGLGQSFYRTPFRDSQFRHDEPPVQSGMQDRSFASLLSLVRDSSYSSYLYTCCSGREGAGQWLRRRANTIERPRGISRC